MVEGTRKYARQHRITASPPPITVQGLGAVGDVRNAGILDHPSEKQTNELYLIIPKRRLLEWSRPNAHLTGGR
jgi:hypothetical protein